DGDVADDRALLHFGHHRLFDDLRSGSARDEDSADDEVGFANRVLDIVAVRGDSVEASGKDVVEFAEAVEVEVDHGDLRAHAESNLCGVGSDDTAADDTDAAGRDA